VSKIAVRIDFAAVQKMQRICSEWGVGCLLLVSLVAYFLDWHVVHRTNALEGFSLFGPSTAPLPLHDTGAAWTCSGFSHYRGSFILPTLLVGSLVFTLLTRNKQNLLLFVSQVALGAATLGYAVSSQLLVHMFERVETLPAEPVFFLTLLSTLLVGLARVGHRCFVLLRTRLASPARR